MVGRIGVRTPVGAFQTQLAGEYPVELVADEDAVSHQVPLLGGYPLGVVTDCGQTMFDGPVGGDVHHRRAVAHPVELVRGGERGSSVGGFVPDRPVVLGGVADRLMNCQPKIGRVDHQVGGSGDHTGRLGLLRQQGGQLGQFRTPVPHLITGHRLPPAPGRRGQGAHRLEAAGGGIDADRLQSRHRAHPLLGDRGAEGVGIEHLLFDAYDHCGDMVDPIGSQQPSGIVLQHRDLVGGWHRERVDAVVRHPGDVAVDRFVGQFDPVGVQAGQGDRHPDRVAGRFGGDVGGQSGVGGESPGAVDEHAHRQADVAVQHRRLQFAVAKLDDFGGEGMHPQVGVAGPTGSGRGQGGLGEPAQRQGQEVLVDPGCLGTHRSTVNAARLDGVNTLDVIAPALIPAWRSVNGRTAQPLDLEHDGHHRYHRDDAKCDPVLAPRPRWGRRNLPRATAGCDGITHLVGPA